MRNSDGKSCNILTMAMRGRWCRTRIGNIFLIIIAIAMILFVLNYFYGLDSFFRKDKQAIDTAMGRIRSHRKHHRGHRRHGSAAKSDIQTCPRPKLDLAHDIIKGAFHQMSPLRCVKKPLFFYEDGAIRVNQTESKGKKIEKCVYRAIDRIVDSMYVYSKPHVRYQGQPFDLKIKHDFFRVQCFVSNVNPGRELKQVGDGVEAANELQHPLPVNSKQESKQREGFDPDPVPRANVNQGEAGTRLGGQGQSPGEVKFEKSGHVDANPGEDGDTGVKNLKHNVGIRKQGGDNVGEPLLHYNNEVGAPQHVVGVPAGQRDGQLNPVLKDENQLDRGREQGKGLAQGKLTQEANVLRRENDKLGANNVGDRKLARQQNRNNLVPREQNSLDETLRSKGAALSEKSVQEVQVPLNHVLQSRNDPARSPGLDRQIKRNLDAPAQPVNVPVHQNDNQSPVNNAPAAQSDIKVTTVPPTIADMDSDESYDNEPDYDQFFAHIQPRKDVFERIDELQPKDGAKQMNVLMVILDSLSHMSWKRKLPQTYRYLRNSLGSTILDGYNIIGDGTTPNIVALLTVCPVDLRFFVKPGPGKKIEELPETRKSQYDSTYVDRYPLLWLEYEKKGYVTLFAEDEPSMGTFNLRLNGFEKNPTDHYMRPFWQAVWDSTLNKNSPRFCLGEKPKHQYMLDYGKDFFVKYHNVSKFGILFHAELTHADNNPGEHIDVDLVKFLVALKSGKYLDNTLLVVMSDHGARYSTVRHTIQGKLEERLPLMALTFPKWFQKKYPKYMKNLDDNVGKLTTPFDVYETLKDVLDVNRLETTPKYNDRGKSVLQPIPKNRTCSSAAIPMHWCTCLRYEELDTKDKLTRKAAEAIVTHINELMTEHRSECHQLVLQNLLDAKIIIPNEQLLKYYNSFDDDHRIANFTKKAQVDSAHLQMTLDTGPNNAIYEGTVLANFKDGTYKVTSEISRLNLYKNEPHCVIDKFPELRKFCYCKKAFSQSPPSDTFG